MIDRRTLTMGLGAMAAAALAPPLPANAQIEFSDPGIGPWTNGAMLRRAGGVLHHAELGTAQSTEPPVILLHKLGGWMADWRFVAPSLAQTRRVIAFDLPGHGDSRWDGDPPYIQTLSETASLLVGALDELDIPQIDLVGTSLGGCVSVSLAAHYPERIRNLALVSCALGNGKTLAQLAANDVAEVHTYDSHGLPYPLDAGMAGKVMGMAHPGPLTAEQNASRRRAGRWIAPSERGVGKANLMGMLPRISARTLLVYGDRANAYLKYRAGAEAALRNSHTVVIPDSGAFAMQDNPSAMAAALIAFLSEGQG